MIPIQDVYLYEDRAQIVRRATLSVQEGVNGFLLRDLSPLIVHKSVQVSLGTSDAKVNFVETRVELVEDNRKDRCRPAEADAMLAEETAAERHANQQKLLFEQYRDLHRRIVKEVFVEASWGQGKPQHWREKEATIRAQKEEAFRSYQDSWHVYTQLQKRNRERNVSGHVSLRTQKKGLMEIEIFSASTMDVDIEILYILPNACWRPSHRMERLKDEVRFDIGAMVWQHTGADWENVRLHFSTERSSLGVKAPTLQLDRLSVVDSQKEVFIEEREQEIHGVGGTVNMDTMPGINDGGQSRQLKSDQRISIPSNGKPYFSHVHSFVSPCSEELLVIADQVPAAVVKTVQENHSTLPILPGPVELVKEKSIVGRAKIDFVSPRESFEIGWGGHPGVRIRRKTGQKSEKAGFFAGGQKELHTVSLFFSNIGASDLRLRCVERLPVSEIEQVQVKNPETQKMTAHVEKLQFDSKNGFLEWEQVLPKDSRIRHSYSYVIIKDASVRG